MSKKAARPASRSAASCANTGNRLTAVTRWVQRVFLVLAGLLAAAILAVMGDVLVARFLFQAEDGIRHIGVTGVQTCALPISAAERHRSAQAGGGQGQGQE